MCDIYSRLKITVGVGGGCGVSKTFFSDGFSHFM